MSTRALRAALCRTLLALLLCAGAQAQDEDAAERLGPGDPARGATLLAAAGCSACHGAAELAGQPPVPQLEGQLGGYLLAQFARIRSGARSHPAANLPAVQADAEDLAAALAARPLRWPVQLAPEPATAAVAAALASRGDHRRGVIACSSCHGRRGEGTATSTDHYPALAGQSHRYLRARLEALRSGPPAGTPPGVMHLVAKPLTDSELDALAAWFAAGAPPARPAP